MSKGPLTAGFDKVKGETLPLAPAAFAVPDTIADVKLAKGEKELFGFSGPENVAINNLKQTGQGSSLIDTSGTPADNLMGGSAGKIDEKDKDGWFERLMWLNQRIADLQAANARDRIEFDKNAVRIRALDATLTRIDDAVDRLESGRELTAKQKEDLQEAARLYKAKTGREPKTDQEKIDALNLYKADVETEKAGLETRNADIEHDIEERREEIESSKIEVVSHNKEEYGKITLDNADQVSATANSKTMTSQKLDDDETLAENNVNNSDAKATLAITSYASTIDKSANESSLMASAWGENAYKKNDDLKIEKAPAVNNLPGNSG